MSDKYEYGPWVGWNGGGCPVTPSTLVQRAYLGPVEVVEPREAGGFVWANPLGCYPIVAYRIATPKPKRELVVGKWYRSCTGKTRQCIFTEEGGGYFRADTRPGSSVSWCGVFMIDWSVPPRDEAPE